MGRTVAGGRTGGSCCPGLCGEVVNTRGVVKMGDLLDSCCCLFNVLRLVLQHIYLCYSIEVEVAYYAGRDQTLTYISCCT